MKQEIYKKKQNSKKTKQKEINIKKEQKTK